MKKDRMVTALLAILGGSIGLQFFYMGNSATVNGKGYNGITKGVFSVLFCWTGIPAIIGLIMGIIVLTQSDEEFGARYGVEVTNVLGG